MPQAQTASAGTLPVTFRPVLRQQPHMIKQALPSVRDTESIRVGLFEPRHAVCSLAKRPFPGFLEPELPKKIFIEWSTEETAKGMVVSRDQPIFPNRDAAITRGIDVPLRLAWNPASDLEDLGLLTRERSVSSILMSNSAIGPSGAATIPFQTPDSCPQYGSSDRPPKRAASVGQRRSRP